VITHSPEYSLISTPSVIIHVGEGSGRKTFTVPKGLLCQAPWFAKALRENGFKEGTKNVITLPKDDPQAFEIFVFYLCHKAVQFERIPDVDEFDDATTQEASAKWRLSDLQICLATWVFGEKYDLPHLQNLVLLQACNTLMLKDSIRRLVKLPVSVLDAHYGAVPPGSPPRIFIAEYIVDREEISKDTIDDFETMTAHENFLDDISTARTRYHDDNSRIPIFLQPTKHSSLLETKEHPRKPGTDTEFGKYSAWKHVGCAPCEDCQVWTVASVCEPCMETGRKWPCKHNYAVRKCWDCKEREEEVNGAWCQNQNEASSAMPVGSWTYGVEKALSWPLARQDILAYYRAMSN
jgi:hypothetical protein